MLEGSFFIMGQKVEIKDCLQNNGVSYEQFVETCNGLSNGATAFGAPPAKITYFSVCPAKLTARCDNLFGGALSAVYYQRDPKALTDTEASCKAGGGKWTMGR